MPLPVRRKEFERNAKREFTKALTTLTSYALVPASISKEDGREGVRLKVESIAAGKNGYVPPSFGFFTRICVTDGVENAML